MSPRSSWVFTAAPLTVRRPDTCCWASASARATSSSRRGAGGGAANRSRGGGGGGGITRIRGGGMRQAKITDAPRHIEFTTNAVIHTTLPLYGVRLRGTTGLRGHF